MKNKFYVYVYLRRNRYSPYYVGKGCGYRCYENRGKPCSKPPTKDRIVKIKENLTEEEALTLEVELIRFYGRVSEGGVLHNRSLGGEGGCSGCLVNNKPCVWQGVSYVSRRAAAKALGVKPSTITKWLEKGLLPTKGRLRSVTIEGVTYKSVAEAARALNIKPNTLHCRIKKGSNLTAPLHQGVL